MIQHRLSSATSPNWAPSFAGVADRFAAVVLGFGWRGAEVQLATFLRFLFSREGGSPVWVPAFAEKHPCGVGERQF